MAVVYQAAHSLGLANNGVYMLNCITHLYPRQWIQLYFCDFLSGVSSLVVAFWYEPEVDLSLPENYQEFNLLVNKIKGEYNIFSFENKQDDLGLVLFTTKYRRQILSQNKTHAITTIIFGVFEIGLALICMLWIERLETPSNVMYCK